MQVTHKTGRRREYIDVDLDKLEQEADTNLDSLGVDVRMLRLRSRLTLANLYQLIGSTAYKLSNFEKGDSSIRVDQLCKIAALQGYEVKLVKKKTSSELMKVTVVDERTGNIEKQ